MAGPFKQGSGEGLGIQGFDNPHPLATSLEQGLDVSFLSAIVNDATVSAKTKLAIIQSRKSSISIGDMFDMQMLMNHLSQLSEMATNVVAAMNTSMMSMARSIKQ